MISLADKRNERHKQQIQNSMDQMLKEKQIVARDLDGEARYMVTAGAWCEDLRDDGLDARCSRELVYELESRGLLRLCEFEGEWLWKLTPKGQRSILASYDKAAYEAWEQLGLKEVADRKYQLVELLEQTGLVDLG
ncbi:MAG: hypothetical protein AB7P20_07980 [Rhizobiaceae bacterium]